MCPTNLKIIGVTTLSLTCVSPAAMALTVHNQEREQISIGVDAGNKEDVRKIQAGKSADLSDFCPTGCGLTGPWGYSVLANAEDTVLVKNGQAWIEHSASSGAGSGESGQSRE